VLIKSWDSYNQTIDAYIIVPVIDRTNDSRPWDFDGIQELKNIKYEVAYFEKFKLEEWDIKVPQDWKDCGNADQHIVMEQLMKQIPSFFRAASDRVVNYGDGGQSTLLYPIYWTPCLSLPSNTRNRLARELLLLSKARRDHHSGVPVEDFVDPDLGPWVLGNPVTHRAHMLAALEEAQKRDPDSRKINANLRDLKKDVAQEQNILAYFNLREKYQWIPSEFLINRKTKDVQIVSRIHDLPAVKKNKKLICCPV